MEPRKSVDCVADRQRKRIGVATTFLSLLVIAALTLRPGQGLLPAGFDLCVLCGTFGTAAFILNVLLFVPLGIGLRLAGLRRWYAWGIALAVTVSIEMLQNYVIPGRDSTLGDIVSNALGGVVGIVVADASPWLLRPAPREAWRLSITAAAAIVALAAATQWSLGVSLPRSVYYEQIAPNLGQFDVLAATILDARADGAPFRDGPLSPDSSATVRAAILAGRARVDATMTLGPPPRHLAPIVSVFDQRGHEIFVLGRRQGDLAFRVDRRTWDLRLHPPSVTLPNALPATLTLADTVRVAAEVRPGHVVLETNFHDIHRRAELGVGVWTGWRLLLPDDGTYGPLAGLFTTLWIAALCAPAAYWAGRATRPMQSAAAAVSGSVSAGLVPMAAIVAALALVPWSARAPAAPGAIWITAGVVSVLGFFAGGWGSGRIATNGAVHVAHDAASPSRLQTG